jgi:tetratricopeptide (TPR) repeat protein
MKLFFVRCIIWLAVGLALACFGLHSIRADNTRDISHEAAKLNQRGLDHLRRKEYDQAIASFREALQVQAEYPDALDNLGKALEATGKDAEAIAEFDKAIKIAPDNAAAHADKGMALFHEGKYEEAAASYRLAIEHHKDFSEAQNGLGASLLHLGKNDEAIAAFRSSVTSNPQNADALGNLGAALLSENKSGGSAAVSAQGSFATPGFAGCARELRCSPRSTGQTQEALAAYHQLTSKHPEQPAPWAHAPKHRCTEERNAQSNTPSRSGSCRPSSQTSRVSGNIVLRQCDGH